MGSGAAEKKRIVFVRQKHTPFGGAERYLQRLMEALQERGYACSVLHAKLPRWLPSWLKALLFDRQICASKSPDRLYFSLDRVTCPDIYRAGDGVHRAFLATRGLSLNPLHPVYLALEKRAFENARIVIANSRMVKSQILEHYPIDEDKIAVVYNGVPLPDSFDPDAAKSSLAAELGFDPHRPILLFVGSGFRRKGVEEFLRHLSTLRSEVQALVVGKEKRMGRYRDLAHRLGLGSRVLFTGPRRDVERFYAAADIFLFPTHYEPFSNVVLEAMSYATVAFTTRQNGAAEILDSPYVMKSPSDPDTPASIDRLLEDPEALRRAKSAARKRARSYDLEHNVRQTAALIDSLTDDRGASR